MSEALRLVRLTLTVKGITLEGVDPPPAQHQRDGADGPIRRVEMRMEGAAGGGLS